MKAKAAVKRRNTNVTEKRANVDFVRSNVIPRADVDKLSTWIVCRL